VVDGDGEDKVRVKAEDGEAVHEHRALDRRVLAKAEDHVPDEVPDGRGDGEVGPGRDPEHAVGHQLGARLKVLGNYHGEDRACKGGAQNPPVPIDPAGGV
jgi:hypothetical protein